MSIEITKIKKQKIHHSLHEFIPDIAEWYYVDHLSINAVCKKIREQTKISYVEPEHIKTVIRYLDSNNLVSIRIADELEKDSYRVFSNLRERLAMRYGLSPDRIRLAWGQHESSQTQSTIPSISQPPTIQSHESTMQDKHISPITHEIGQEASILLSEILSENQAPIKTVVVGPGRAVRMTMSHMSTTHSDLHILPFTGMLGIMRDKYNSSPASNARLLQASSGGDLYWFPSPAILPKIRGHESAVPWFNQLKVIEEIKKKFSKADLVVTSVTAPGRIESWLKQSMLPDTEIAEYRKAWQSKQAGPVGAISGLLFDADGKEFNVPWHVQGFGLIGMQRMVAKGKTVMLVAGDDTKRVGAIHTLLEHKAANCLVTDTATASKLLASGSGKTPRIKTGEAIHFTRGSKNR